MDLPTYLQQQALLEQRARDTLPGNIDECTYARGPLNQNIYACITCQGENDNNNSGVALCQSCAVKCHTSHHVVELANKRNTACDCGTSRAHGPCYVRYPAWEKLNGKDYTPDTPEPSNKYCHNYSGKFCLCDTEEDNEKYMVQCLLGDVCNQDWYHDTCLLPNVDLDSFDTLICWRCVGEYPKEMKELVEVLHTKTLERENSYTILLNDNFKEILSEYLETHPTSPLASFLHTHSYLYDDDPLYEPLSDSDSTSSLFELGLKQINSVPIEQVSKGVEAYDQIKSKLTQFLKPFAQTGQVVTEDEIKNFFANIKHST